MSPENLLSRKYQSRESSFPIVEKDLSDEEKLSWAYLNYPSRPRLIDARDRSLRRKGEYVIYKPKGQDLEDLGSSEIVIGPEHQFSLVEATLFGLNDALVRAEGGSNLRQEFEEELERFNFVGPNKYGTYAYYPATGDLAQYAPERYHRLALVTSNSSLLLDADRKLKWEEVREIFDDLVVAIAGASLGNNVAHSIARDIRPKNLKIADPNLFKVSNANRVGLSYEDIVLPNSLRESQFSSLGLKNKAIGAAEQIHRIDPFMRVWAYFEGVNLENIHSFAVGNRFEPGADFIVEETDNPDAKIMIREMARRERVKVIMATDAGSAVQIDIRNFDFNPNASLAVGISDEDLYKSQKEAHEDPSRENFYRFAESLIGDDFRGRGEFGDIIDGKLPKMCASVPQLGSTAAMAGSIVAEVVARTALGYKYPERFVVDKKSLEVRSFGEKV